MDQYFTVTLRGSFPFRSIWMYLLIATLLIAIGSLGVLLWRLRGVRLNINISSKPEEEDLTYKHKRECLNRILELKTAYTSGKINKRQCCQKLSILVREFVNAMTGIAVQYDTLKEIEQRRGGFGELKLFIEKCYDPEFAEISDSEIESTLECARQLVEKW